MKKVVLRVSETSADIVKAHAEKRGISATAAADELLQGKPVKSNGAKHKPFKYSKELTEYARAYAGDKGVTFEVAIDAILTVGMRRRQALAKHNAKA